MALLVPLGLALSACLLTGIEPDEIDVADEETGGLTGEGAAEGEAEGDGDGDATGDGDADESDSTGDGDGDPNSTTGGDGDGDPDSTAPCVDFGPTPVVDGDNAIEVTVASNDFEGSCGGVAGPDAIFSYTAVSDGLVSFTLANAEFDAVLYLVGDQCVPLDEWACDAQSVETLLTAGQTVFVIVDSNQANVGGAATLSITGP